MRAHVVRVGPQGHAIELFVSEPQAMVAVADEVEVLTLDNLEALEARKPQVPAEVIARTQGALIGWQNADEFDTEELQEHGDALRDATRALLAAVEAAPEGEPPRVLRWEGYAEPGPDEGRDVIVRIHCDSIAARRFCGTGKIVHVESAVEAPAPDEERLTEEEWEDRFDDLCASCIVGDDPRPLNIMWNDGCEKTVFVAGVTRANDTDPPSCAGILDLLRRYAAAEIISDEEGWIAKPPTPDFASMSSDNLSLEEVQALRDWLDERGDVACAEAYCGGFYAVLTPRPDDDQQVVICTEALYATCEAALLALCQAVAAKEAGA